MRSPGCPLCESAGGELVATGAHFRLIRADEAGFPAFYRLVWGDHVAEFSDLAADERQHCMEAVAAAERLVREHLSPDKVNLAALGNQVPHLHWHLIARFRWDSHFPSPVWAAAQRPAPADKLAALQARLPALDQALRQRLAF
ncbi:HIT family protein [Ramlibacter tataouinensis]|uniref:HIT domain-containing protein n=1 Tax=Ramlibacter tataouinensis (strain ATCC BAA-407 / DSM 14655 / LMG 21543 / TTB310) TaxID=365046 RepID=F5XXA0_RAMTT|nr:HIT family protein [Ramlibacter tataouinensis]AEG94235.1 conserved hypothetical protein [Ramlibacter tataouinensis TTB310]